MIESNKQFPKKTGGIQLYNSGSESSSIESSRYNAVSMSGSSSPIDVKRPINLADLNAKQLFYSDFEDGFSTYDWALLRRNTSTTPNPIVFEPDSSNVFINDPAYSIQNAINSQWININIQRRAPAADLFTASSFSSIRMPKNGLTILFCTVTSHAPAGTTDGAAPFFRVLTTYTGQPSPLDYRIGREDWNIDGFGMEGTDNPSGETLSFLNTTQTAAITYIEGGNQGILFSFVLDGKMYPAHFVDANNEILSPARALTAKKIYPLNNSIGFHAEAGGSNNINFDIGYLSPDFRASYFLRQESTSDSPRVINIHSINCITTGDVDGAYQVPFTANTVDASNNFTYTPVTATRQNILELYARVYQPVQRRDSTIFSIKRIEVSAIGMHPNEGCIVEIGYDKLIGDSNDGSIAVAPDSFLLKTLPQTATRPMRVLSSMLVNVNSTPTKFIPRLSEENTSLQFGIVAIKWNDGTVYYLRRRLIIAIRGRSTTTTDGDPTMVASATINGYEQK